MKHSTWKGQHPMRFTDTESIKSNGNRYKPAAERRLAQATETKAMMNNTLGGSAVATKKNLREILEQNNLYDEVLA